MKEIIIYKAYIKDLLQLEDKNENVQIIRYNKERHYDILLNLYSDVFPNKQLDVDWDKIEDFYEKGIFLAKDDQKYVAFILVYITKGKIHIAKFGTTTEYRKKGIIKKLILEVARHFDTLSYEKIYTEVEDDNLKDFFSHLGFKQLEI